MPEMLAPLCLVAILGLAGLPSIAQANTSTVEGTYERFAHGTLEVRSISDCTLRGFSLREEPSKAVLSEIAFADRATSDDRSAVHRRFINVIVTAGADGVRDIAPSDSTVDADKKCLTDLGTQHLDGTVVGLGYGNNGAGFDLRLSNGHTVAFGWVYDYGSPRMNPRLGQTCDENHVVCKFAHGHVRVTYKTRASGDGVELVPIAIDPI